MTTNHYIVKTDIEGVKLLTINDVKSYLFSLQNLIEAKEDIGNFNDSLQLYINHSHIVIATTQNEDNKGKIKKSIKVMNVPIAEM